MPSRRRVAAIAVMMVLSLTMWHVRDGATDVALFIPRVNASDSFQVGGPDSPPNSTLSSNSFLLRRKNRNATGPIRFVQLHIAPYFRNQLAGMQNAIEPQERPGCNVTWCGREDLARPAYSVLFQLTPNGSVVSDTTPPISVRNIRSALAGRIRWPPRGEAFRWPSRRTKRFPPIDVKLLLPPNAAVHSLKPRRCEERESVSHVPVQQQHPNVLTSVRVHDENAQCLGQRNVIFGYATNLRRRDVTPFVESFLRHSSPCDDLVLWVGEDLMAERWPASGKGRVIMFLESAWIAAARRRFRQIPNQAASKRVIVMLMWLETHHRAYRYAIHVDARDSLFFANPFAALHRMNLTGIFSVAETIPFHDKGINQNWVKQFGGTNAAADYISGLKLHSRWVSVPCSGIYGGTAVAMWDYLAAFGAAMLSTGFRERFILGLDQGVHIYLQFIGLPIAGFPHAIGMLDEATGPIHHWMTTNGGVRRDPLGRYLNCFNEPYAILHQLDRYPHHWSQVFQQYSMRRFPGTRHHISTKRNNSGEASMFRLTNMTQNSSYFNQSKLHPHFSSSVPRRLDSPLREFFPSGVCLSLNAVVVVAPPEAEDEPDVQWRLQTFIAAVQRHHNDCDDVIVLRARCDRVNETYSALAVQAVPAVVQYTYSERFADPRLIAATWLRSDSAAMYTQVAVFTDVTSLEVAVSVHSSFFLHPCLDNNATDTTFIGTIAGEVLHNGSMAAEGASHYQVFGVGSPHHLASFFTPRQGAERSIPGTAGGQGRAVDGDLTAWSFAGLTTFRMAQAEQPSTRLLMALHHDDVYVVVFELTGPGEVPRVYEEYIKDYPRRGPHRVDVAVFEESLQGNQCDSKMPLALIPPSDSSVSSCAAVGGSTASASWWNTIASLWGLSRYPACRWFSPSTSQGQTKTD